MSEALPSGGAGLAGKIAWITGGGSGIGLAGAKALVKAGATVIISGRRGSVLEAAARGMGTEGPGVIEAMVLDVNDLAAIDVTAQAIQKRHGGIDILVNNAGINVSKRSWSEVSVSEFVRVLQTNLNGAMAATHAVLPVMRSRGSGLIINVASWAGRYDTTFTGPAYNASKHALVALSATVNMDEGRHGIRACALCPGEVATEILQSRPVPPSAAEMARMLQPEDLGAVIGFLAGLPKHVCINELVISPTWNRAYLGVSELAGPRP